MLAGRVPFVTRNAHSLIQAQLARGVDACVCERWNVAKDGGARHVADQVRWWGARAFDAATGIVADILAPAVDAPCLSRLLWVEALDVCTRLCAGSLLRGMQIPARCGGMNDNNKIKDTHTHTHTHIHTHTTKIKETRPCARVNTPGCRRQCSRLTMAHMCSSQ